MRARLVASRFPTLWWQPRVLRRGMHDLPASLAEKAKSLTKKFDESTINWYPGHMASAVKVIEQKIKASDLVLEVRDARVPLSSACGKLEKLLLNRRHLILLNKADKISEQDQSTWKDYFAQRNQPVHFTDAANSKGVLDLLPPGLKEMEVAHFKKDRAFVAMIIGIPNTGKSTLINALRRFGHKDKEGKSRRNANKVGARPGVTRHVSVIQFYKDPPAHLIDTPGIMNPKRESGLAVLRLALTGAIKDEVLEPYELAEYLLYVLNAAKQYAYVERFGLEGPTEDTQMLLQAAGEKMGILMSKKEAERRGIRVWERAKVLVDVDRAAAAVIKLFRQGDLGLFVLDDVGE